MKSRYTISKKIPTVFVDREIIERIEEYLKIKVPKLLGLEILGEGINRYEEEENLLGNSLLDLVKNMQKNYEIILYDTLGEEIIYSINDYNGIQFLNGIYRLVIRYKVIDEVNDSSAIIIISFGKEEDYSEMQIRIEGKNAKENGIGILNVLSKIINDNGTKNYILYPNGVIDFLIFLIGMGAFIIVISEGIIVSRILAGLYLFMAIIYKQILPKFKPYTEFNTKKQREHNKITFWLITGFIGFLIFGVLFVWIRKEVFGF